jgi:hypothetical protein
MTRLDALNRTVLTIVAVLLAAAGVYGLLRGEGAFGDRAADEPLIWDDLRTFVDDNAGWFWLAAAVLALVIAWLAWRWLRVQLLPTPSLDRLPVGGREQGTTQLSASAVSDAVRRELEASPDVSSARVRLVGDPDDLGLDIRATVAAGADQERVRRRIEDEVLPRAAEALEDPDLGATIRLRLGEAARRAVA